MIEVPHKRRNWNDHLSDFSLEESGDYNYRGSFYTIASAIKDDNVPPYDGTESKAKGNELITMVIISLLALLFAVLGGIFPATGATNTWYVILPFGLTIAFSGVLFYHMVKLARAFHSKEVAFGYRSGLVREYIYEKTWPRIGPLAKITTLTAIITLITETLFLLMNGKGEHFGGAILLLACMLITGALEVVLLYRYNAIKWRKIAKNEP